MPDTFILRDWQSLYFLTGTAAATLIGLMFVGISLGARLVPGQDENIQAFVTPTITHFGLALIFSMLLLVPTYTLLTLGGMLVGFGAVGGGYCLLVARHMLRQHSDDDPLSKSHWIWHFLTPCVSYLVCVGAGLGLFLAQLWVLNLVVLGMIGLLVTGLHNAYDLILWIARQPG